MADFRSIQLFGGGAAPSLTAALNALSGVLSGVGPAPGVTVSIFVDGSNTAAGTTVTASDGTWSYTPIGLGAGAHTFVARVLQGSVVVLASPSVTFAGSSPTLAVLTLLTTAAVVGSLFTANVSGQTAGSSITATSSDGTALTVSGSTVSGTFTAAGSPTITLVETLAGATGSPKTSGVPVTVSAAAPTLSVLALSPGTAKAGSGYSGAIANRTSGSTITAVSSDGTALTVSGATVSGTFNTAGAKTVTLTETLTGAIGNPKTSTATVTVSAATADSSAVTADNSSITTDQG